MDELEDNIIRAIQEVSLKEALQDEERKIQRKHKIYKIIISILVLIVCVILYFLLAKQHCE